MQEAAFALVHPEDRGALFHRVGNILLSRLTPSDLDEAVFVVTNLLNEGDLPSDFDERTKIAELNRKACQKSFSMAAFASAAEYAAKGIALVSDSGWKERYDLKMDLYSMGAEVDSFLGNVERMRSYCTSVMEKDGVAMEDKLRVQTVWLDRLASDGKIYGRYGILLMCCAILR